MAHRQQAAPLQTLRAAGLELQVASETQPWVYYHAAGDVAAKSSTVIFVTSHDQPLDVYLPQLLALRAHFHLVVVDTRLGHTEHRTSAKDCIQAAFSLVDRQQQLCRAAPITTLVVHGTSSYPATAFGSESKTLRSILVLNPTAPPPTVPAKRQPKDQLKAFLPPNYTVPTYILSTFTDLPGTAEFAARSVELMQALDDVVPPHLCIMGSSAVVGAALIQNMMEFLLCPLPLDIIAGTPLEPEEERAASVARA